ncbi:hypothetical protein D3C86_1043560 [compost metagenome]
MLEQLRNGLVVAVGIPLDAVHDDHDLLDVAQVILGQVAIGVDRHVVAVARLAQLNGLPPQGRGALGRGDGLVVVVGRG